LDGKPALDSKESYLKVHKTRVKIKEKMANGGMMAMGGEVGNWYKEGSDKWGLEKSSIYIKENGDKFDVFIKDFNNKENKWYFKKHTFDTFEEAKQDGYDESLYEKGGMMAKGGVAKPGDIRIGSPLTENNIDGAIIMNIDHPEWGTWTVLRKYDDRIWEIRGRSGVTTLFLSELKFWKRINYAEGGYMASGGDTSNATKVKVGSEIITLIKDRKEKTGYPVYVVFKGYAPVTVDLFETKELALKKAKSVSELNGYEVDNNKMASGGEVIKEYEVEFTWDTSDDESRSVYIKAKSEDEARKKASDRYKAYKEFKIIKVVDTASPYWHD
jgi:hypothetical protein